MQKLVEAEPLNQQRVKGLDERDNYHVKERNERLLLEEKLRRQNRRDNQRDVNEGVYNQVKLNAIKNTKNVDQIQKERQALDDDLDH